MSDTDVPDCFILKYQLEEIQSNKNIHCYDLKFVGSTKSSRETERHMNIWYPKELAEYKSKRISPYKFAIKEKVEYNPDVVVEAVLLFKRRKKEKVKEMDVEEKKKEIKKKEEQIKNSKVVRKKRRDELEKLRLELKDLEEEGGVEWLTAEEMNRDKYFEVVAYYEKQASFDQDEEQEGVARVRPQSKTEAQIFEIIDAVLAFKMEKKDEEGSEVKDVVFVKAEAEGEESKVKVVKDVFFVKAEAKGGGANKRYPEAVMAYYAELLRKLPPPQNEEPDNEGFVTWLR